MIKLVSKLLKLFLSILISIILTLSGFNYFYSIIFSNKIQLEIGIKTICLYPENSNLWHFFIILFFITFIFNSLVISYSVISKYFFIKPKKYKKNKVQTYSSLNLLIGLNSENNGPVFIPEPGLYQNILITGTIGSGKTSSAMYPFTKQLISYCNYSKNKKIGMLILDVKGNYYKEVLKYATEFNRLNDIIVISLYSNNTYNPLNKPNLKPSIIANQLKTILLLFSPNNSESYWIDKVETVLCEAIKFCRLYNNGYVTFLEIHKIITQFDYYMEKANYIRNIFLQNKLTKSSLFDLLSCLNFFNKEFFSLDERTLNILKSEITRITNCFVSDYDVKKTFCPNKEDLTFDGFYEVVNSGKIVVLNMNINEYRNLSKIIAAYLKIDFQTEVMSRLSNNSSELRTTAFISDEYSEYVSATDANFFSQSREAKCINIISTQSYTSLLNALNNQYSVKVIVQNLVNKLWFRSDDVFTIEDAQKQIGKAEKEKSSKTISENAKQTIYNYFTSSFNSKDSNISESINKYSQFDYIYDTNFFTQKLETFTALSFLSTGDFILPPCKLKMLPYFK